MNIQLSEVMMSYPHNFLHISFTENDKNLIFRYVTVNVTFYPPKINEKWCLFWHISIQGYAFICIRQRWPGKLSDWSWWRNVPPYFSISCGMRSSCYLKASMYSVCLSARWISSSLVRWKGSCVCTVSHLKTLGSTLAGKSIKRRGKHWHENRALTSQRCLVGNPLTPEMLKGTSSSTETGYCSATC